MFDVFNTIYQIERYLKDLVKKATIRDYHISLKLDTRIIVHVLSDMPDSTNIREHFTNPRIQIIEVTDKELDLDPFYRNLFEAGKEKIDLTQRRRYRALLERAFSEQDQIRRPDINAKVISFYSYKGGMGRSTSLAVFASYYARKGKTVALLDFDFEAPGFINFFGMNEEILSRKKGAAEYILDKEFTGTIDFDNYYYTVSKEFSGEGAIYMIPAGNNTVNTLADDMPQQFDNNLKQYLEGLARLDFANKQVIIPRFADLIQAIDKHLHPNVILIDSRTGMNDIFGILSFFLSDLVIGFFGTSNQNKPGLHYFLDTINSYEHRNIPVILANAIIAGERYFEEFDKDVDAYLKKIFSEQEAETGNEYASPLIVEKYPIYRESVLEETGVPGLEQKDRFIKFVEAPTFYYREFLEAIENKINELQEASRGISEETSEAAESTQYGNLKIKGKIQIPEKSEELINVRQNVLKSYHKYKPELYPEDQKNLKESVYSKTTFYFRQCMEEIFNQDKFILKGGKGTGKTYLYRAFRSNTFIQELQKRMNGATGNYRFKLIIPLEKAHIFHIESNISLNSEIDDTDFFFHRFWLIYIWNQLIHWLTEYNIGTHLDGFEVNNDTATKNHFIHRIHSDEIFNQIEQQLKQLDTYLSNEQVKINLLFDQLDEMVKPKNWDKAITPLISMFRAKPFTNIIPKIFIRTDLFNKLGNLTNKNELQSQIVTLEWSQKEIFAFFFKVILAHTPNELYMLLKKYLKDNETYQSIIKQIDIDNQIPLNERYIKPFVQTFFGKWADIKGTSRFGESYDWFYKNLQNADGTISLRPFIDLINEAVKRCLSDINNKNYKQHKRFLPVLSSHYYAHAAVRKKAVERHYIDLADEAGNEDIKTLFKFIKDDLTPKLRLLNYSRAEFNEMLGLLIRKHKQKLIYKTVEELRDLLILNGIVSQRVEAGGYTGYSFALLYKYFLGLSDRNRKVHA